MAQATTKKKVKAQAITVDSVEAEKFDTTPAKIKHGNLMRGYKYEQPIDVLIRFELSKRKKAFSLMNKHDASYTAIINDALDLLLYVTNKLPEDQIKAQYVRDLIKGMYKPTKIKKKTQE